MKGCAITRSTIMPVRMPKALRRCADEGKRPGDGCRHTWSVFWFDGEFLAWTCMACPLEWRSLPPPGARIEQLGTLSRSSLERIAVEVAPCR